MTVAMGVVVLSKNGADVKTAADVKKVLRTCYLPCLTYTVHIILKVAQHHRTCSLLAVAETLVVVDRLISTATA